VDECAKRLRCGERVLLFPEGGVGPGGTQVGPFYPMLFEACLKAGRPCLPVALRFTAPRDPGVWEWIEEPNLAKHLFGRVLPAGTVRVEVRTGEPLSALPGEGRKELAQRAHGEVLRLLAGDPSRAFRGPGGTR
jgi:1-acyl-sn-glycerol-3-phosphate acyltransferase